MTRLVVTGLLLVVCAFGSTPVVQASQQTTIENELDAAKVLYRDGRLEEAIGALRSVIARLNELRDIQNRRLPLAEAHFHLGLAYLAMRDESAAIENFRQVAALDPDRVLDPEIYSPRVIDAFERARSDVVRTLGPKAPDQPAEGREKPGATVARPTLRGEALRQVLPGTKLRVGHTGALFGVEGQLIAIDDTVLSVGAQNWRLDVPREALTRIEIVTERKNHWLAGMVIGAALGALIGALETPGCGTDGDCYTRGENIGYGGTGLGLVGALVGALYRTDQWTELPLDRTSSTAGTRRGPRLFFSWRY